MREALDPIRIVYWSFVVLATLYGLYALMGIFDRSVLYIELVPILGMRTERLSGDVGVVVFGFTFMPFVLAVFMLISS